ncbi:Catenin alpha-2 [Takifugu flavidus]|uniref:Catenin alpha-2 n=1 Tax=Takifugu flavidus TaxID=433684 RepID=A0A5C6MVF3_9TELE|nr:Catenin alpha-2 [Takifugu flavidus]
MPIPPPTPPCHLTSHLMKTLERLILAHLRPLVSSFMDPLQFTYQPSIGVDNAIIYLLHTSLTHLEKTGSTVRIMFFDFSSAFNTIQPRLLGDKLQVAGVDHHLTTWILDYLTQRPQFVRVKGSQSDWLLCSTGVPQGTVLAPFLFTLYTADFSHSTSSCHLQKRNNPPPAPVNILGTDVDVVESYKYLGVHLNNNLDWTHNTDALVKKGNSRLFLLRRLRSFGVQGPLLRTFYDSVVGSAIFYGIGCWSSSITDRDRKRMDRRVRRASSVLGCPLDSVEVVGNGRMMAKLSSMLNNTSHPLQDTLTALGSSFNLTREAEECDPPIVTSTSALEIREPVPRSPGPASSLEGVLGGLRRSSKYSFHRSTTSQVELRKAVMDHISDSFLETNVPLLVLIEAAKSGNEKEVKEYAQVFREHANKLVETTTTTEISLEQDERLPTSRLVG